MKSGGLLFSILLLFGALLVPSGISYAQEESVGLSDQITVTSNQTSTTEEAMANQTSTTGESVGLSDQITVTSNQTSTATEESNLGQQISSFVHDA
ncbi:MAG: hypothetical protein AABZ49_04260, partial [Thermoproteota archaeon]